MINRFYIRTCRVAVKGKPKEAPAGKNYSSSMSVFRSGLVLLFKLPPLRLEMMRCALGLQQAALNKFTLKGRVRMLETAMPLRLPQRTPKHGMRDFSARVQIGQRWRIPCWTWYKSKKIVNYHSRIKSG